MRSFFILCFAGLTVAAPQGYNYATQPNNNYLAPSAVSTAAFNNQGIHNYQQEPLISKRFFIHSAPEEQEVEVQHREIFVGQPRKNFNVVFIKSPVAAAQKTKIRLIPATNEEKTVVYVLSKKADENQVVAHVEEPHTTTAKPEVFFIKYKTNEEAEHAQLSIQAEYDRLGGSSIISNEGIAPVSSVIGSVDSHGAIAADGVGAAAAAETGAGSSVYLPPVKKQ